HCAAEGEALGFRYEVAPAVVPNAIDEVFFAVPLADARNTPRVVFVGSLIARKRVDLLISATMALGVELVIICEGEARSELEQQAKAGAAPELVRFLGQCEPDRIAKELARSSLLCVPSTSESF